MALTCLNCDASVVDSEAKIFAGVFCCPICYSRAERLEENLQLELRRLMTMTRETIRIALVEGKLHFGADSDKEVSKTALLQQIVKLEDIKDAKKHPAVGEGVTIGPDGRPIVSYARVKP